MNAATNRKPAVIVITSHVGRGAIGGRASVFALERLGFPVWFVPTVWLPWHPGHGPSTRIVPPTELFEAALHDFMSHPALGEVGAVLTGYLGDKGQVGPIGRLVDAVKSQNPDATYLLDPAIGDDGQLYVPNSVASGLRDQLVPRADIMTPNKTEFLWLAGKEQELEVEDNPSITNDRLAELARSLPPELIFITSAIPLMRHSVATLAATRGTAFLAEHRYVENSPHGVGDLFAGLLLGFLLEGRDAETALERSASSVFDIVARSVNAGSSELCLAAEQGSLVRPMSPVRIRRIGSVHHD